MKRAVIVAALTALPRLVCAQPEVPVEKWTGKTILVIGAHADDDAQSHGTLAMLQAQGNQVYIVTLTTGNVGTQDPDLSRFELAAIRRNEEIAALAELGIPADHYINLGYDDGLLEFEDRKSVVERLVYWIRKLRPDVLFAFDPGRRYQRWHKSDHRTAAYLAADAARAAMWRLLFEGHIIQDKLKAYMVPEYMLYDSAEEDRNTWVDISQFVEKKISAASKYVSQWGPGWERYQGPNLTPEAEKRMKGLMRQRVQTRNGKPVEGFRHYKGLPDSLGK